MACRPPKVMEMGATRGNISFSGEWKSSGEVETLKSLIRDARLEPINVRCPSDEEGR